MKKNIEERKQYDSRQEKISVHGDTEDCSYFSLCRNLLNYINIQFSHIALNYRFCKEKTY